MEKLPSIHEERFERIEEAIVYIAECIEDASWKGAIADVKDILYSTPVSEKELERPHYPSGTTIPYEPKKDSVEEDEELKTNLPEGRSLGSKTQMGAYAPEEGFAEA